MSAFSTELISTRMIRCSEIQIKINDSDSIRPSNSKSRVKEIDVSAAESLLKKHRKNKTEELKL